MVVANSSFTDNSAKVGSALDFEFESTVIVDPEHAVVVDCRGANNFWREDDSRIQLDCPLSLGTDTGTVQLCLGEGALHSLSNGQATAARMFTRFTARLGVMHSIAKKAMLCSGACSGLLSAERWSLGICKPTVPGKCWVRAGSMADE